MAARYVDKNGGWHSTDNGRFWADFHIQAQEMHQNNISAKIDAQNALDASMKEQLFGSNSHGNATSTVNVIKPAPVPATPEEIEQRNRVWGAIVVTSTIAVLAYRHGVVMEWPWWAGGLFLSTFVLAKLMKTRPRLKQAVKWFILTEAVFLGVIAYRAFTSPEPETVTRTPSAQTVETSPQGQVSTDQHPLRR